MTRQAAYVGSRGASGFHGATREVAFASVDDVTRVVEYIVHNGELRRALATLRRDWWLSTHEYVALTGEFPARAVTAAVVNTAHELIDTGTPPPETVCREERIVRKVTDEVWDWVRHTRSAAEQALECTRSCLAGDAWAVPGCLWECGRRTLVDIVTSTWKLVGTTTREVVTWETHCVEQPGIPTVTGRQNPSGEPNPSANVFTSGVVPLEAPSTVVHSLVPLIECLVKGEWDVWHIKIGNVGVRDGLPIGIKVCLDKACADEIAKALSFGTVVAELRLVAGLLVGAKGFAEVVAAIEAIPILASKLTALAAGLGLTLAQGVMLVMAVLAFLGGHALAVAGQIAIQRHLGNLANGICLHHPTFVLAPVLPVAAMNTPLIVTGRG